MALEPIPTVDFDPATHLISCRENKEGRQVFVTLQSLSKAEEVYEAAGRPVAVDDLRAEIEALKSRELPENIVALIQEQLPPPELTQETMGLLAELSKAVVQNKQDLTALSQKVDQVSATIVAIGEKLGGLK